jgi:hypothetical protein
MGFFTKTVRSTHNQTTRHGHKVSERIPTGETGRNGNLARNTNGTVYHDVAKHEKPVKAHKRR